jgi:hypothetical protein
MAASTIESLRRFDLEQAGKRRGVVERHNIEDAEPFAGVAVDLLAGLDYDCIGGLAEIVPSGEWSLYLNTPPPFRGRTPRSVDGRARGLFRFSRGRYRS